MARFPAVNTVFQNHPMQGLGMALVWIGFLLLIGLAAVLTTANTMARGPRGAGKDDTAPPGAVRGLGSLGAIGTVGSLAAPWIRGTGLDGAPLELTGWSGLDPLTLIALLTAAVIGLSAAARKAAPRRRATMLLLAAGVALLLVAGNLLIQAAHPAGSRVQWGFWLGLGTAALMGAAGGLSFRAGAPRPTGGER